MIYQLYKMKQIEKAKKHSNPICNQNKKQMNSLARLIYYQLALLKQIIKPRAKIDLKIISTIKPLWLPHTI